MDALKNAVILEFGLADSDVVEIDADYTLLGVWVKAMNPSVEVMVDDKKVKRQNYELVNICEVDA